MPDIDKRIPLTEVTQQQYDAIEPQAGMLYGIVQTATGYINPATDKTLKTVLVSPFMIDQIPFFEEDTLYCISDFTPLLTISESALATSTNKYLCVSGEIPYQTQMNGILRMTKTDYDALASTDPDTAYIVSDGTTVHEYFGSILIR